MAFCKHLIPAFLIRLSLYHVREIAMENKRRKINSIDLAVASAQVPLDFGLPSEIRKKEAAQTTYEKQHKDILP
jgi:hypothetical protein